MEFLVLLLVNAVAMACMGSAVVMESNTFPYNQWLLVLAYTLGFSLLFCLYLVMRYNVPLQELRTELKQWRQYALIGMFWDMNYLFILLSAPYLPNTIQVVLAQFQCLLIAFIDYKFLGIVLTKHKKTCVALTALLGLAGIAFNSKGSKESAFATWFWSAVFLVNSFAGGFAQLCTEALLKLKMYKQQSAPLLAEAHQEESRFDVGKEVLILNFVSNVYGGIFCILGLPLAMFSLQHPPIGLPKKAGAELVNISIFADTRIFYWVLMLASSFVYTVAQGHIATYHSAIYAVMASSFGAFLQLLFFLIPSLPKEFRQPFDLPGFLLALGVTVVGGMYTARADKRDMLRLRASIVGKYYDAAIGNRPQHSGPLIIGLSVYAVTWIAIAAVTCIDPLQQLLSA